MKIFKLQNVYAMIAIIIVYISNAVFLGIETLESLLGISLVFLTICLFCRLSYRYSNKIFNVLFWLFIVAVFGNFAITVIATGQFTIESAGNISLGFLFFLALLGIGGIEIILFFSGVISLLVGGIWLNNQMANFDILFTAAILLSLILVVISVYRLDFKKFSDINRNRITTGKGKFPVVGRFMTKNFITVMAELVISMIIVSILIFIFIPRSETQLPKTSLAENTHSGFRSNNYDIDPKIETAKNFGISAKKWAAEFSNEIDLDYSFKNSFKDKRIRFKVQFLESGEIVGSRYQFDDFYTKVRVFDKFENDKWKVSDFVTKSWISPKNLDGNIFTYPMMEKNGESKFSTVNILEHASMSLPYNRKFILVKYFLGSDDIFPRIFQPDFPTEANFGAQTFNPITEEFSPTMSMPDKYWIQGYRAKINRMQGLIADLDTQVDRTDYLLVGQQNEFLAKLAAYIIQQANASGEYVLFDDELRDFDKVKAVLRYLSQDRYKYEITPPKTPEDVNPIEFFLNRSGIGNCTHFNTAAAILLRYLGIPTRVVAGYRGGNWDYQNKLYNVEKLRAHLWFEVCFKNFGWARFDATPGDDRDDLIDSVLDGNYAPPNYNNSSNSQKPYIEDKSAKPNNEKSNEKSDSKPKNIEENDEKTDVSFISNYNSKNTLNSLMTAGNDIVTTLKNYPLRTIIVVLLFIALIRFRKIHIYLIKIKNRITEKSAPVKKRKELLKIERTIFNEFQELERLFMRLGFVKKPAETWLEFANCIKPYKIMQRVHLKNLIEQYYTVRFGFAYDEYEIFQKKYMQIRSEIDQVISLTKSKLK